MNPTEQASLRSLQSLDQTPPTGVWDRISLELERGSLSESLKSIQETPNPSQWDRIKPSLPTRKKQIVFATAGALLILTIGSFIATYLTNADTHRTASFAPTSALEKKIQTPPNPALVAATTQPEMLGNTEAGTRTDQKFNKSTPIRDDEYLWVASRSGDPIRIHNRWQELSCCLSGENLAADCYTQKQQWHQEIEASNLGFQADPLLGLIELLETAEKPSTFSPIL